MKRIGVSVLVLWSVCMRCEMIVLVFLVFLKELKANRPVQLLSKSKDRPMIRFCVEDKSNTN